jgi:2-keto-3-deoxy-L-arabinonate dehydratase
VLATPFHPDGSLDEGALDRLVAFQVAAGVDGLALFGLASETWALTDGERATILDAVVRGTGGTLPIVAGVNTVGTASAVEQARRAADGGAHALMVLPPYLVKPSPSQLMDFYGEVAARSGLPVMVQDAPGASGVTMPPQLILELSKLEGVTSVKVEAPPTAPKIGTVAAAAEDGFDVLGGQNALFCLEEYAQGAVGTMPACEFADLLAPVLADRAAGRHRQARAAFNRLLPLIRFGLQPGIAWAVHKEVLVARGIIPSATVRAPATPLDKGSRAALHDILEDLRNELAVGDGGLTSGAGW